MLMPIMMLTVREIINVQVWQPTMRIHLFAQRDYGDNCIEINSDLDDWTLIT